MEISSTTIANSSPFIVGIFFFVFYVIFFDSLFSGNGLNIIGHLKCKKYNWYHRVNRLKWQWKRRIYCYPPAERTFKEKYLPSKPYHMFKIPWF